MVIPMPKEDADPRDLYPRLLVYQSWIPEIANCILAILPRS